MFSSPISMLYGALISLLWLGHLSRAIELDINDENSIKNAISIAATNAQVFYIGNQPGQTPGLLVGPYYWWECGGYMGLMIQRWALTGNDSYNDIISQAILHQVGDNKDFTPTNQSVDLGNDDQVFWAFAAMDAAELNFPNPPDDQPQWLALAQAVFNDQTDVWDQATCNGGMRWQIIQFNTGYDYKNIQSNGGYFHLSARLARYTGNQTYADYADKMWNWLAGTTMLVESPDQQSLQIWDGIHVENCSVPEEALFTYNAATLISGAAYMFNYTNGNATWQTRLQQLMNGMEEYFVQTTGKPAAVGAHAPANGSILCDPTVEYNIDQDPDQPSFKAYTLRWLAVAGQLAPFMAGWVDERLTASAQGAAAQCTGQAQNQILGTVCGRQWYSTSWDGNYGVGEQMSAMSAFQSLLVKNAKPPFTQVSGGTSQGNASGGGYGGGRVQSSPWMAAPYHDPALDKTITTGDTVGASILTLISIGLAVASVGWMVTSDMHFPDISDR